MRVLVTGSTRGIGLAVAKAFLAEGAKVAINGRQHEATQATAQSLGGSALALAADIGSPADARTLVEEAASRLGGIDILVNNAGMNVIADALSLSTSDWQRVIDVNLSGAFYCSQSAARIMLAHGGGCIINMASAMSFLPLRKRVAYACSKAALVTMTRVLAGELAPYVRVNAIAPGYTQTEMIERIASAGHIDLQRIAERTPLRRLAEPDDVAAAATFLASSAASFISGETLVVDGGWLACGVAP